MSNAPKNVGNHDANTWVDEIDIDDMTGEIARTLLACEEIPGPKSEHSEDDQDESTWGGFSKWFM